MIQVKGNFTIIAIMTLVIIAMLVYLFVVIQNKKTAAIENSSAFSVLNTSEGQEPYTDLTGNPLVLTDYFGEILVVISWASWCPSCLNDLPELSLIAESYKDKGVRVLAINRSEPMTTAERFLRTVKATSSVVLILDPDDKFYKSIDGYAMPEILFYDKSGNVVHQARGSMNSEDIKNQIEKIISTMPN